MRANTRSAQPIRTGPSAFRCFDSPAYTTRCRRCFRVDQSLLLNRRGPISIMRGSSTKSAVGVHACPSRCVYPRRFSSSATWKSGRSSTIISSAMITVCRSETFSASPLQSSETRRP